MAFGRVAANLLILLGFCMSKKRVLGTILAFCAVVLYACGEDSSSGASAGSGQAQTNTPGGEQGQQEQQGQEQQGQHEQEHKDPNACENANLKTSNLHCGECNHACGRHETCENGECVGNAGYLDCDKDGVYETYGECSCEPGQVHDCYFGSFKTKNVGECKAGRSVCVKADKGGGVYWDDMNCQGQVLPSYDYICDPTRPNLDLDCDGNPDAMQDDDGDGYAICNPAGNELLDCCDNSYMCNTDRPDLVNPGRTDCFGNHIDDNCSGTPDDNTAVVCGSGEAVVEADCKIKNRSCSTLSGWQYATTRNVSASGALALAKAFDACLDVVTEESGEAGLIEYEITPASDYNIGLDPRQFNIKDGMYDESGNKLISPRIGDTFVILSSGIAGDAYTELKTYGKDDVRMTLGGSIPEPYRTAHHNQLQTHQLCASGGADIYDTVRLHLKMRAPKNAKGISFDFRFFSREYPYYVCSKYNDFFLALLTDAEGRPIVNTETGSDGNISFDRAGNPISVNNAFFTTCAPAPCNGNFEKPMTDNCPAMLSCDAETSTCGGNLCTDGMTELAAYYPDYYSGNDDDAKQKRGGGTAWLTTKAPVNPGEVFNLDFYIWDTGDLRFDSSVILDNFQWSCTETTNSTDFAGPVEEVN